MARHKPSKRKPGAASIRVSRTAPSDFIHWLFVTHDKRRAVDFGEGDRTISSWVDTKPTIVRDKSGKRVR